MCAKRVENKRRRRVEEEDHTGTGAAFQSYVWPLEVEFLFKYLGIVLTTSGNYRPAVVSNLIKYWQNWDRMYRFFQKGADAQTSRPFYKLAVQATLLFVLETWVMTSRIFWSLKRFHHRLSPWLAVMQPQFDTEGRWE